MGNPTIRGLTRCLAVGFLLTMVIGASAGGPADAANGGPVGALRVEPETGRAGYDRGLFPHWRDLDRDGCDTRAEVLLAESHQPPTVHEECRVVAGEWVSVYDGVTVTDPAELEVDHVVALAEAWDSGAHAWDPARRRAFANDLDHPETLIAVTIRANRSKSDSDPSGWRPSDPAAHCAYGEAWTAVKVAWDLAADQAEVDALRSLLAACPTVP